MHAANGITNNVSLHFWHFAIQNDASGAWAEYRGAERALTYRKPLSRLAFAANRKAAVYVCASVFLWVRLIACFSLCVGVNCLHACTYVRKYINLYIPASCVCVLIGTQAWRRCNTCSYMCVHVQMMCVSRPPPFRSEASVMVLQRSGFFQRLVSSGRPCLKVTTPHHRIISLPFHTSLSVWLIFKNKASPPPNLNVAAVSFTVNTENRGGGGEWREALTSEERRLVFMPLMVIMMSVCCCTGGWVLSGFIVMLGALSEQVWKSNITLSVLWNKEVWEYFSRCNLLSQEGLIRLFLHI